MKREKGTLGFFKTFDLYPVTDEWVQELYNYFINGYEPGSFHTALFANDLATAAFASHPHNTWNAIQGFVKWVDTNAPARSVGSYENVGSWLALSDAERREICIMRGWLLTDEELAWQILKEKKYNANGTS